MAFTRATKAQAKLRLALCGPAGSGKTFTALTIARGLVGPTGKIAVGDSERGSASKFAGIFDFDVDNMGMDPRDTTPFAPSRYEAIITAAVKAQYDALILDSISHAWQGKGGVLEAVDNLAARKNKGNSFMSWGGADGGTAIQNHFIDAILSAPIHIIVTMRTKMEYIIETDLKGKMSPRRVGLAPRQRDDVEYEFDIVANMDHAIMTVVKSRCPEMTDRVIVKPGLDLAEELATWLSDGERIPTPSDIATLAERIGITPDQMGRSLQMYYGATDLAVLRPEQLTDLHARLRKASAARQQTA